MAIEEVLCGDRGIVRRATGDRPTLGPHDLSDGRAPQRWKHVMTDPRDIAHDKRMRQEKKKSGQEIAPGADKTPQPGKKTHKEHHASDTPKVPDEAAPVPSAEKTLD